MACGSPMSYRMNSRRPGACRSRRCASGHRGAVRHRVRDRTGAHADADRSLRQMLEHRAAVAIDQPPSVADLAYAVGNHGRPDRPDVLFVLGFILKRRVLYPVVRLATTWSSVSPPGLCGGDAALYPVDEIVDMAQAIRIFRENGTARPSAAGAAARRRLGGPRAAGAYDSAAAGL